MAIDEIEAFFQERGKDFFEYRKNPMLKKAVERNLEIIGEALNRILKRDESFEKEITNAKAIIGLRNQIIHAYDNISDENIWSVLTVHLPLLKKEINFQIDKAQK
jgi:uncharacterized protein with HEPN domain